MQNPLARATTPLGPQRTISPPPHPNGDQLDAVTRWQSLLDAHLIGHTPPPAPHVIAIRGANDALFRARAAAHRAAVREHRA